MTIIFVTMVALSVGLAVQVLLVIGMRRMDEAKLSMSDGDVARLGLPVLAVAAAALLDEGALRSMPLVLALAGGIQVLMAASTEWLQEEWKPVPGGWRRARGKRIAVAVAGTGTLLFAGTFLQASVPAIAVAAVLSMGWGTRTLEAVGEEPAEVAWLSCALSTSYAWYVGWAIRASHP